MISVKLMNIYIETIMEMAHNGVESMIQIKSDNTKKAHQMTTVKLMNENIEIIQNMTDQGVESDILIRSDKTKRAH